MKNILLALNQVRKVDAYERSIHWQTDISPAKELGKICRKILSFDKVSQLWDISGNCIYQELP